MNLRLCAFSGMLLVFMRGFAPAQVVPWPKYPDGATWREYKAGDAYGARYVNPGTFFHKGLDLNGLGGGNTDLNYPLFAFDFGTIFGIGKTNDNLKWIGVDYGNGRTFAYLHIFPDDMVTSTGTFVGLIQNSPIHSFRRIFTDRPEVANDGVILFYSGPNQDGRIAKALGISGVHDDLQIKVPEDENGKDIQASTVGYVAQDENAIVVDGGIDGILNTLKQGDDVVVGNTIRVGGNKIAESRAGYAVPQTIVAKDDIIAPLGKSGKQKYAHLHLQISSPDTTLLNDKYPANPISNDGWNNVIQYLERQHFLATPYSGGISLPAPDGVIYHAGHDTERIQASIRWRPQGADPITYHEYELDRVKIFAVPSGVVASPDELATCVSDDTYLINSGRDVLLTGPNQVPNQDDPFRAEFNYGGTIGGSPIDVDNAFPPFINNTGLKYRSYGIGTGLAPKQDVPITDFIFNQWNTQIHKNFGASIPLASKLALRNQDAAYPDGWYGLVATAESVDRDAAEKFTSDPTSVNIDNFRPYVDTVTIADVDDLENPVYSRRWDLSGSSLKAQEFYPDGPLIPGHTYNITATMSEYTNYATMHTQDGANIPVISGVDYTDTHNSEYTGEITIPADITEDKVVPLVINDSDLAENPSNLLLKIDSGRKTDINPALELTRNTTGAMQGAGGDDTFHHLRIDAASPIIGYNRHEQDYQAFDGVCSSRPTDLCGTEEEPINIVYSDVPFGYTGSGSGVKELTIYKETLGGATFYLNQDLSLRERKFSDSVTMTIPDGKYVQTITDNLA